MAKASKPFACIINPDDPLFSPPGDMPSRIMDYCKATGQHVPTSIGEIIRCVLDSLALCYRATVEGLSALTGKSMTAINIVGGGTQNKLLCKLTADVTGIPVIAGPVEATAAGNILSQMITAGDVGNIWEAREVITASFPTEYYEPSRSQETEFAYEKFLGLVRK
jgi:sugar (pentulose or hexulose) kinase